MKTQKTKGFFLLSGSNKFRDRKNLILQEKAAGNTSKIFTEILSVLKDKIVEYKCLATKRQNFSLDKGFNSKNCQVVQKRSEFDYIGFSAPERNQIFTAIPQPQNINLREATVSSLTQGILT